MVALPSSQSGCLGREISIHSRDYTNVNPRGPGVVLGDSVGNSSESVMVPYSWGVLVWREARH